MPLSNPSVGTSWRYDYTATSFHLTPCRASYDTASYERATISLLPVRCLEAHKRAMKQLSPIPRVMDPIPTALRPTRPVYSCVNSVCYNTIKIWPSPNVVSRCALVVWTISLLPVRCLEALKLVLVLSERGLFQSPQNMSWFSECCH